MQINADDQAQKQIITAYSPFSTALETLEKQIKYFLSFPPSLQLPNFIVFCGLERTCQITEVLANMSDEDS